MVSVVWLVNQPYSRFHEKVWKQYQTSLRIINQETSGKPLKLDMLNRRMRRIKYHWEYTLKKLDHGYIMIDDLKTLVNGKYN